MMKKLLYILLITTTLSSFAQEGKKDVQIKHEISSISVYPNPFSEKTNINFNSKRDTSVDFIVQDLLGNRIHSDKFIIVKGRNSIPFYRNKLTSGIYIYTLKTKNKVISKRFVIK